MNDQMLVNQRLTEIDVTHAKQIYPGHLSPTEFITPKNQPFNQAIQNISIPNGQSNLINFRQKQTQLPQLQVLPIKNIHNFTSTQTGLAGVNSGTMNNPKNSSGVTAFQRDNSQGNRRQSSS